MLEGGAKLFFFYRDGFFSNCNVVEEYRFLYYQENRLIHYSHSSFVVINSFYKLANDLISKIYDFKNIRIRNRTGVHLVW